MNAVTVTTDQIMMTILGIIGLYVTAYHIKWVWKVKRTLFHSLLAIMTGLSTGGLITNAWQRNAEESQQIILQQQEARRTQIQQAREARKASEIPLTECGDPNQIHFPGEWWQLYQSLMATNYYESMLSGIESFTVLYSVEDVEPLPMAGLDLICNRVAYEGYIKRARKALNPYLAPFNEAPTCFRAEPKDKKTEEKDG